MADRFELFFPKKVDGEWLPIPAQKFTASGCPEQDTAQIKGTLFNSKGEEFKGKLIQLRNYRWDIAFESYHCPPYKLRIEWIEKDGSKHCKEYECIPEKPRKSDRKHDDNVTILSPGDNDQVLTSFCATGTTDLQSDISGTISKGAYLQEGNVITQPGTSGLWSIQFTNVPPGDGYTVRVEIAGHDDESTDVEVLEP